MAGLRTYEIAVAIAARAIAVLLAYSSLSSAAAAADQAVEVEQALRQLVAEGEQYWPGFQPLAIPLAVFDGSRTFLFRHPAPAMGFEAVSGVDQAYVFAGRHQAVVANSSVELNDVLTATLMLDAATQALSPEQWAATAVHEAFHVYQRQHYPGWPANEADLFMYPSNDVELLALRRLENGALKLAVEQDPERCWARTALNLRSKRYQLMDPAFAKYERHSELNEGLASYVQLRALGENQVGALTVGFDAEDVRRRAYATGAALALLLDRVKPGWSAQFGALDDQYLDVELRHAIGSGPLCEFSEVQRAEAQRRASADIAQLSASREQSLSRFLGQSGWQVVVEVDDQQLLWPSGFDPLNVERVSASQILHTRFIRLSNEAGYVELIEGEALTTGAGEHPLFAGVKQLVVGGLAQKPAVSERDGTLTISVGPLSLELIGAEVSITGQRVSIRLD